MAVEGRQRWASASSSSSTSSEDECNVNVLNEETGATEAEYLCAQADYGPSVGTDGLKGDLVVAEPNPYGCGTLWENSSLGSNKPVFLVSRSPINTGTDKSDQCTFEQKTRNAEAAGAIAVVVYDSVDESLKTMAKDGEGGVHIPSVLVSQDSGEQLLGRINASKTGMILVVIDEDDDWIFLPELGAILVAGLAATMMLFMLCGAKYILQRRRTLLSEQENGPSKEVLTLDDILLIPTVELSDTSPHLDDTCAVCLVEMELGDRVKILPCDHAYHPECITPWLTERDNVCPLCKQPVRVGSCAHSSGVYDGHDADFDDMLGAEDERQSHNTARLLEPLITASRRRAGSIGDVSGSQHRNGSSIAPGAYYPNEPTDESQRAFAARSSSSGYVSFATPGGAQHRHQHHDESCAVFRKAAAGAAESDYRARTHTTAEGVGIAVSGRGSEGRARSLSGALLPTHNNNNNNSGSSSSIRPSPDDMLLFGSAAPTGTTDTAAELQVCDCGYAVALAAVQNEAAPQPMYTPLMGHGFDTHRAPHLHQQQRHHHHHLGNFNDRGGEYATEPRELATVATVSGAATAGGSRGNAREEEVKGHEEMRFDHFHRRLQEEQQALRTAEGGSAGSKYSISSDPGGDVTSLWQDPDDDTSTGGATAATAPARRRSSSADGAAPSLRRGPPILNWVMGSIFSSWPGPGSAPTSGSAAEHAYQPPPQTDDDDDSDGVSAQTPHNNSGEGSGSGCGSGSSTSVDI